MKWINRLQLNVFQLITIMLIAEVVAGMAIYYSI